MRSDHDLPSQIIRLLINGQAQPPMIRLEFESLSRLHATLLFEGFKLVKKTQYGPEAGYMLFYLRGKLLVRIKTRGEKASSPFRSGLPHVSFVLLQGNWVTDEHGRRSINTDFDQELGKFDAGGNLVPKTPPFKSTTSWIEKAANETWSDNTHFIFPNLVCEDSCVDNLSLGP